MSKKSKRQAATKAQAATRAASERKSTGAHPAAKRPARSNGQVSKGSARSSAHSRKSAGPDARTVRIAAIAVAVLALAGALYWAYATRGAVNAGLIVGLVALGLVAGLAIYTAVKTEAMVSALEKVVKR